MPRLPSHFAPPYRPPRPVPVLLPPERAGWWELAAKQPAQEVMPNYYGALSDGPL